MSDNKTDWITTSCYDCGDWGQYGKTTAEQEKTKKELELAKVQMEIAKLPNGSERDKLIEQLNSQAELNRASEKNLKLYIGLGIIAVLAVGYFAYKKLKK